MVYILKKEKKERRQHLEANRKKIGKKGKENKHCIVFKERVKIRDRSAHPWRQRQNEPKREKWDRFAQKKKWDWTLRPSTKEKNELDKSRRNVRESHIHEERAIINSKGEESKKRADRSAFFKERKQRKIRLKEQRERERERSAFINYSQKWICAADRWL